MKHTVTRQHLLLYVSAELSDTEQKKLEKHLSTCTSCRREVESLGALHAFLRTNTPAPSERTLTAWRRDVLRAIRSDEPKRSTLGVLRAFFGLAEGPMLRPALALLAVGCLAFVIGFNTAGNEGSVRPMFSPAAFDPFGPSSEATDPGNTQVVNVQVISKDDATGEIEFEFEAMFRSRVKGNIADPAIQAILARALVSSQNPGVRLRAVNAFSESLPEHQLPRKTREIIKLSLVSAVKYDENQGVRLEALKALQEFMPDTVATSAILHVLMNDPSSAMKIAAINSLDLRKITNARDRDELSEILRDRSLNDENNYIRIKAKAALQEAYQ